MHFPTQEKGELNPQAMQAWDQMYHSDIKMSNVLLSGPSASKYPGYPSPVLGDWGFVQACPAGVPRKGRGGTPCTESPENGGKCWTKSGRFITSGAALNPKSDVWSVGMVIYGLMDRKEGLDYLNFRKDPQPRVPNMTHLRGQYSNVLLGLAAECMNYYPEDRPSFGDLLHRIRLHTSGQGHGFVDQVRGLRSKSANDPAWQRAENRLERPIEVFRMYSKLAWIPDTDKPGPKRVNLPRPPHPARKLSEQMEYKGRVSADDTSLQRAGSVRRKAAELGPAGREAHLRFLNAKEKGKGMRARARARLEETRRKNAGGFRVPDSNDDEEDDDDDGDWPDEPVVNESGSGTEETEGPSQADPFRIPDSLPQPQDLLQERFRRAPVPMRRSRSAGAGARRVRYDNRSRDDRSASPRRSPRKSSELPNPYLAPPRPVARGKR